VHGEFAVRGEVIDVFVPGQEQAVRILLDFDEVTAIRSFDPLDQGSTGESPRVQVAPCREVTIVEEMREIIAAGLEAQGFSEEEASQKISALIEDPEIGGGELFFPLCFPRQFSLLEYLGPDSQVSLVDGERLESSAAALRKEYLELFRRSRSRKQVVPGPQRILLDYAELLARAPHRADFPALPAGAPPAASAAPRRCPPRKLTGTGRTRSPATGPDRSSATSPFSAKKWKQP
jgi:transcription-repair coupling factor (superfamily II helicase)